MSLYVLLALLIKYASAQVQEKDERQELAKEFIKDFKQGTLSNEQLLLKYVEEGNYFKIDSIRQFAGQWMNYVRDKNLQGIGIKEIDVLQYLGHEDEFAVSGVSPIGEDSSAPHKLIIKLGLLDGSVEDINMNDLYIVKLRSDKNEQGSFFILFNDENRIISFASFTIGYQTTLMKF